ncbi:hypothetical protein HK104_002653 [Borealophlyctis nickersoniae]|nr:hypothetical protein HK104_002653 [Borealophlyctis nickersoniae]
MSSSTGSGSRDVFGSGSMLLAPADHRVVVAFDFGTSHSGFAYAHVANGTIEGFYEWDDQPAVSYTPILMYTAWLQLLTPTTITAQPYCKTLSAIQYGGDLRPTHYGYTALKDSLNRPDAPPLLTRFKFGLERSSLDRIGADLPRGLNWSTVITDYLKCHHQKILELLQRKYGPTLQNEDILWCLTIPAMWSEEAKLNLRMAAARAGFIPTADPTSNRLLVILEPEAAALYCCKNAPEAQLKNDDIFMVVDAGGGTVDITVHRVISGAVSGHTLAEVCKGSGEHCGSTFVDEHFLAWLAGKVGEEAMEVLKRDKPNGYFQVLKNWEMIKRQFRGPEDYTVVQFSIPGALYNLIDDVHMEALEEEQDGTSDDVFIRLGDMLSFFDPIVTSILELIDAQLNRCPGGRCDKLFLVGGFATSPYVEARIKERFAGKVSHFIYPAEPGAAIVKGAVLYGLNPRTISARRSRYTYGTIMAMPQSSYRAIHPTGHKGHPNDIFTHEEDYTVQVLCFVPVMKVDQLVEIDEFYSTKCEPLYRRLTTVTIQIFATPHPVDRHTCRSDVPELINLGSLTVSGIPYSGDRSITLKIYFGRTELTVVGRVNATGVEKREMMMFSTVTE